MDKVYKQISDDEIKDREKRMKLQKVNIERQEDAQKKHDIVT